ncbi:hypothetical protein LVJ82_17070 [Vitreoscilla massiliensis]|uniref:Uncharacterized protein n=1 Tax=Vitreoscilla massiliensis TaxID=1689272 RepID=A0ABY4E076_9NEIS|nr:hypothetical protein [Vitreoscilla massiliensis]UOO89131.1 hypothetical protein LVJ82_17070 [Vitreoscilla massiliensis]
MRFIFLVALLIAGIAHADEIKGLGDIKIGSNSQQVKALMKTKKAPVFVTGADFGTYQGGGFGAYEKVNITNSIQLAKVSLYYHDNYLYWIDAVDDFDDGDLKTLVDGFKHKYKYLPENDEIVREEAANPCDEKQQIAIITKSETFNKDEKIEAKYSESIYLDIETNKPVNVCGHYVNANFSVYDVGVLKAATEKQEQQDSSFEQEELDRKYEGL